MFEPNQDYNNHTSSSSSSPTSLLLHQQIQHQQYIQQDKYDQEMAAVDNDDPMLISTNSDNNNNDDHFYQDLLTMEMLPSSSSNSATASIITTTNTNNDTTTSTLNHQQQQHYQQYETAAISQSQAQLPSQQQSTSNQEYPLETLSDPNSISITNSDRTNEEYQPLLNQQQSQQSVQSSQVQQSSSSGEETFLLQDYDIEAETNISDPTLSNHNLFHSQTLSPESSTSAILPSLSQDSASNTSVAIITTSGNNNVDKTMNNNSAFSNLNPVDSSSHTSLEFSPKIKRIKTSPDNDNCLVDDSLTKTNSTSDTSIMDPSVQHQDQFDYVESLINEYHSENNGECGSVVESQGNDGTTGSNSGCHDFLTNLEVGDSDSKVVDQFIASTTTTIEDASASLITSSEDILHQATAATGIDVDCLVNESWFDDPPDQPNSQNEIDTNGLNTTGVVGTTDIGNNGVSLSPSIQIQQQGSSESLGNHSIKSSLTSPLPKTSTKTSTKTKSVKNQLKSKSSITSSNLTITTNKSLTNTEDNHNVQIGTVQQQAKQTSSSKFKTPTEAYLSGSDHDEIARHTLCPICDNPRPFCSSSSVTRHLRSVHKLTDLMESKYCYCLICHAFEEDINAYYQHLQKFHEFNIEKHFSLLFTKQTFENIDAFQKWKVNELEKQAGCEYERCFSHDYPRSIYYKCSGIQIETIKDEDNVQQSKHMQRYCKISVKFKNQTSKKFETADLSKIIQAATSNNNQNLSDNKDGSNRTSIGSSSVQLPPPLNITHQCDARMYPCPSSVRLIFRKDYIEVNYIAFHIGHVVACAQPISANNSQQQSVSQSPLQQTSQSQIQLQSQSQLQLQLQLQPQTQTQTISKPIASHSKSQPKKLPNIIKVQRTTTGPIQQLQTIPQQHTGNLLSGNAQQVVAIASPAGTTLNPTQLAGLANVQLTTGTGKNATAQLIHLPMMNLMGGNIVLTTANPTSATGANHISAITPGTGNQTMFHVQLSPNVSTKKNTTGTNRCNKHSQAKNNQKASNVKNQTVLGKTSHINAFAQSELLPSTLNKKSTAKTTTTETFQYNFSNNTLEPTNPQRGTTLIRPVMINSNCRQTNTTSGQEIQIQLRSTNDNVQVTNGTTYQQSQSYQSADSIDAIETVLANGGTILATAPNTLTTANTLNQSTNNGLVIVSLEKGMEIVQERFRPRKEQLRLLFEQLLNSCFTESDFNLVESSLTSILSHLQLNTNISTTSNAVATSTSTSTLASSKL